MLYLIKHFSDASDLAILSYKLITTRSFHMSKNLLIVIGSVRTGRVADKVLEYIQSEVTQRDDVIVTVADLAKIELPFFNNENAPMSPDYVQTNEQVVAWSTLVNEADSVLFITPEYNHTLSAVQKNALDWLSTEWNDKPVTAVAYGWSGGSLAVATLREVLTNVKASVQQDMAQLVFMKDLNPDGSILSDENVKTQINLTLDEVL